MQISPNFNRNPYQVVYKDFHTGEMQKITRRPAAKVHDMLPTDVVELRSKKNDDWLEGESYTVKHINPRYPNTIQIEKEDGQATFVASHRLELKEDVAYRNKPVLEDEKANQYLLWP